MRRWAGSLTPGPRFSLLRGIVVRSNREKPRANPWWLPASTAVFRPPQVQPLIPTPRTWQGERRSPRACQRPPPAPPGPGRPAVTAAVHCGACSAGLGLGGWARPRQSQRGHLRRASGLGLCSPHLRPSPSPMAPRPLGPLVLALGGAAAVLGSVLFILWKTYFGRGRERRWDRGEAWWGAEAARLPEWDEWDVSAGPRFAKGRASWGCDSAHVAKGCDHGPAGAGSSGGRGLGSRSGGPARVAGQSPGTEEQVGVFGCVQRRRAAPSLHAVGLGRSSVGWSLEGAAREYPGPQLGRLAPLQRLRSAHRPGRCREKPRPLPPAAGIPSPVEEAGRASVRSSPRVWNSGLQRQRSSHSSRPCLPVPGRVEGGPEPSGALVFPRERSTGRPPTTALPPLPRSPRTRRTRSRRWRSWNSARCWCWGWMARARARSCVCCRGSHRWKATSPPGASTPCVCPQRTLRWTCWKVSGHPTPSPRLLYWTRPGFLQGRGLPKCMSKQHIPLYESFPPLSGAQDSVHALCSDI